ncbi:hypothetical protein BDF19DRAFT_432618 [Syncephalis fuscata]|nr:hypothetical protein BDF19DRAFT_432618 [Syncephalis fuscata]
MSEPEPSKPSGASFEPAADTLPAQDNDVVPCLRDLLPLPGKLPLPQRYRHVPTRLAWPVIDAHVHVFPDKLMDAVQKFFHEHYWPVAYRERDVGFLLDHGLQHLVLLQYSHKPNMSDELNKGMVQLVKEINERYHACRVTGLATVFPGEPDQVAILERAFDAGLRGVKLHSHVQRVAADDPVLNDVYRLCAQRGLPILFHTGREPNSRGLNMDTTTVCDVTRIQRVLERHPRLKLVIPHMGNNETREYIALLDQYPNLYLDTTLGVSDFFPSSLPGGYDTAMLRNWLINYADRILYGTDWPNIPHEWCTELWALLDMDLPDTILRKILGGNAMRVYGIEPLSDKDVVGIPPLRPDINNTL